MLMDDVDLALRPFGLGLRGGFRPDAGDGVPPGPDGRPAGTVLMVGNAGTAMWRRFSDERPAGPAPLDRWTRDVLTRVADRFGAAAVTPFQRPYLPFQTWAMRAKSCHASPIKILIHREYGLWHALRGALLFTDEIHLPAAQHGPSPCQTCPERPCLRTCPVQAFSATAYDAPRCLGHLETPAGTDCMTLGCRARRACPMGSTYRYVEPQVQFHMAAFRNAGGTP